MCSNRNRLGFVTGNMEGDSIRISKTAQAIKTGINGYSKWQSYYDHTRHLVWLIWNWCKTTSDRTRNWRDGIKGAFEFYRGKKYSHHLQKQFETQCKHYISFKNRQGKKIISPGNALFGIQTEIEEIND